MPNYRSNTAAIVAPEEVAALLILPALAASVAGQVATTITTGAASLRFPVVSRDPSAAFVNEGAEIPLSDAEIQEVVAHPEKVAGLVVVSRELLDDSINTSATEIVGAGLARDIARRIDQSFFAGLASPAPAGLATLAGVSTVAAPSTWENFDPFVQAAGAVEAESANVTSWIANPSDLVDLAQVKTSVGSNVALSLGDPASVTGRSILGRPVHASPAVAEGTVWGVDGSRTYLVVRADAKIDVDTSFYFSSDRIAVRATMRVAFGFPHPASVVKITRAA